MSDWKDVFGEVPGGRVRCVGGHGRIGQTGTIADFAEGWNHDAWLIRWDNDNRLSWKREWQLESADPRFPMPMSDAI